MTIRADQPCLGGEQIQSILHFTGLQTTMKGGAQVDVNFNNFEDNHNAVWLHNTNQNTTITVNKISAVDVGASTNKGIVIRTQTADAPNTTRVVINNNEFTLASSSGVISYAVDGEQPGRVANISAVVTDLGTDNTILPQF